MDYQHHMRLPLHFPALHGKLSLFFILLLRHCNICKLCCHQLPDHPDPQFSCTPILFALQRPTAFHRDQGHNTAQNAKAQRILFIVLKKKTKLRQTVCIFRTGYSRLATKSGVLAEKDLWKIPGSTSLLPMAGPVQHRPRDWYHSQEQNPSFVDTRSVLLDQPPFSKS